MKVVIELIGNESKQDLLATSNYLRELAGEAIPEATERKTDLDKLADAVVEATKVEAEEKPKTVSEIVESERAKTRAKRAAKPAPAPVEEPAPIEEPAKAEEPAPIEEPKAPVEEPAKVEPKTDAASYTIDDCKSWAMKALNAKKRPIVQEAFESVGASSFPTLKEEMFNDFVAYISSRL
uniref:Uncharacterized protein n=1 Tax=Siphoviridae sp. cttOT32 TaxID=2826493 RepID=A0A8S5QNM0_9CAUD|nr:MAG TPA: hypothetical protein [Siphoviridae sp. cttOT32]